MTCMMTKIQFGQRIQSHKNPKHVTNQSSCILPNTQFRKVASLSFCVDPKDCQGKRRQSF